MLTFLLKIYGHLRCRLTKNSPRRIKDTPKDGRGSKAEASLLLQTCSPKMDTDVRFWACLRFISARLLASAPSLFKRLAESPSPLPLLFCGAVKNNLMRLPCHWERVSGIVFAVFEALCLQKILILTFRKN